MGNVAKLQVGPEETSKEIEETSKEIEETSKEIEETSKEIEETSKEIEETSKEIEETSKEIKKTSKEIKKTSKEIHSRIIDVLEMRPEIAVREIAKTMGMSVSGTRYHIDKLKKNGIFER